MPINYLKIKDEYALYQRDQYEKSRLVRLYWDWRDNVIIENIAADAKVVLDAGCGEGITLERIIRLFPEKTVSGIDISQDNIDIGRQHGLPVSQGDVFHLQMKDDAVDCCILSEVIEHLDRPEEALGEIRRVLKARGKLVIVFPNDFVFKLIRILTFKFKEAFYDAGHLRQWTPLVARGCLKKLGFVVLKSRNVPFYFWPLSLHCIIVAEKQGY
jgi:ubiquinone/menaquinone biosynthesis C-methylase UbiE